MDKLQPSDLKYGVTCVRCGRCCRNIWLPLSPGQLQTRYANWLAGNGERNSEIHLVYPMLKATGQKRFRKINGEKIALFKYKCVHVKYIREEHLWACTIHAHRPPMCRNYPHYGKDVITTYLHKGCAFRNVGKVNEGRHRSG